MSANRAPFCYKPRILDPVLKLKKNLPETMLVYQVLWQNFSILRPVFPKKI